MAAPEVERIDPDPLLSERDTPAAWVDGTVAGAVGG
jgi:hypothetical protein